MSAGSFCPSPSSVITTSPRAWCKPALSAEASPKLPARSITRRRGSRTCRASKPARVASVLPSFTNTSSAGSPMRSSTAQISSASGTALSCSLNTGTTTEMTGAACTAGLGRGPGSARLGLTWPNNSGSAIALSAWRRTGVPPVRRAARPRASAGRRPPPLRRAARRVQAREKTTLRRRPRSRLPRRSNRGRRGVTGSRRPAARRAESGPPRRRSAARRPAGAAGRGSECRFRCHALSGDSAARRCAVRDVLMKAGIVGTTRGTPTPPGAR